MPFLGFIMEYEVYPSLVTEWMDNGTVMEYVKRRPDTDIVPLVCHHMLFKDLPKLIDGDRARWRA